MKTVASAVTNNTSATTASTAAPAVVVIKTEPATDAATVATTAAGMQFQAPTTVNSVTASAIVGNGTKRPISLDLNKAAGPAKKQRLVTPLHLDSPDPNMKTLNTPDLEKILLSSNLLATPQPGRVFPTKVGPVTSEQEAFGKGFEEALHSLHTSKNSQAQFNSSATSASTNATAPAAATTTAAAAAVVGGATTTTNAAGTGMSGGSFTYTNLESSFPVAIKDEAQHPSSSPPVSPIDMETQEKIKLERKRQRNRVAASKCRKRKLERISKLEEKVKMLKGENTDLGLVVKNLKDHVAQLKQQVIEHIETGCSIPTIYNGNALLQGK